MVTIEKNEAISQTEKLVELSQVRKIIIDNFSWVKDRGGVVINAGSTIGGALGHDVDIVVMLDVTNPEMILPGFVGSIDSMERVIGETEKFRSTFSFSRVAWQDFMAELRTSKEPHREEPLGIHFLWYASPEQLLATEPRGLALGLINGEVLLGNDQLALTAKTCCPDENTCRLWNGLDNILDPIRLVANPNIGLPKLCPTIGHTIERFVIWDILAQRVRQKKGFDLVTREDIRQELNGADDLIKSILNRSRKMRDLPVTTSKDDVLSLGKDIIENWKNIRRTG